MMPLRDVRYALRSLASRPAFTAVVVATLALGIGANTAVFSVVRGVMLRPLPYPDEGQLVSFWYFSQGRRSGSISVPELLDLQTKIPSVESAAGMTFRRLHLGVERDPRLIRAIDCTAELLPLLGVRPAAGRFFEPSEAVPDGPPVVVIGDRLRRQAFGDGREALGASLTLNGASHTVVGVMPPGFAFPGEEIDVYRPFRIDRADPDLRNNHYLWVVARLRPGASVETARGEVAEYGRWAVAQYPEYYSGFNASFDLTRLRETFIGSARTPLVVLLVAVSLVLLIACVNVANLLIARGDERRREVAVRRALGASTGDVARQLLIESAVLAALGALVALPVAAAAVRGLIAFAGDALPRAGDVTIDAPILAYTLVVGLGTSVLFGLGPVFAARRADLRGDLYAGHRTVSGGRGSFTLRRMLVTLQVALAVILTLGAVLLVRTVAELMAVGVGFDTEHTVAVRLALPEHVYDTPAAVVAFVHELEERAAALPGVESAGVVESVPLWQGSRNNLSLQVEGRVVATVGEAPTAMVQRGTSSGFAALGLSLQRGAWPSRGDVVARRPVAVVNEAFVRTVLAGADPAATRVRMYGESQKWMEIVGVAGDFRQSALTGEEWPQIMVPLEVAEECAYGIPTGFSLVARGTVAPASLIGPLRRLVRQVGTSVAIRDVSTLASAKREAVGDQGILAPLMGIAAALALILAVVGLYGVVSLWVGQRRPEIGLRLALGAAPGTVRRLVMVQAAVPVLVGLAVGLAAAVPLAWMLRGLLHGVSVIDPVTLAAVVGTIGCAGWLSAAVPTRRATRVDPATTLRSE